MLGRATRLCPDVGKQAFRIFDAVRLYEALGPITAMQPVVVDPQIPFSQLAHELATVKTRTRCRACSINSLPNCSGRSVIWTSTRYATLRRPAVSRRTSSSSSSNTRPWTRSPPGSRRIELERDSGSQGFMRAAHPYSFPHMPTVSQRSRVAMGLRRSQRTISPSSGRLSRPMESHSGAHGRADAPTGSHPQAVARTALGPRSGGVHREKFGSRLAGDDESGHRRSNLGLHSAGCAGDAFVSYDERVNRALQGILSSRAWTTQQRTWLTRIAEQTRPICWSIAARWTSRI